MNRNVTSQQFQMFKKHEMLRKRLKDNLVE